MSDMRIDPVIRRVDILKAPQELPQSGSGDGPSFGKIIKGVFDEAVSAESEAGLAVQDFAAGNITDVHDVVMAVGKANMAIQLLVQVRNGVLEAYQELSRVSM
jgi:flagellar hook-basal body complex protein FliE